MENLKSPAQPFTNHMVSSYEDADFHYGFTKLEYASLMAMQGMLSNSVSLDQGMQPFHTYTPKEMASMAVRYAAAVLEEANK